MPVDAVGTGHPDGEARAMPHGSVIASGTGKSVLTGGSFLIGSGTTEVAAYRSVVLVIGESGGSDVQITIKWTFYDSSGNIHPTETQVAKGGQSTRLLFQNRGDLIETIRAVAVGSNTTVDWYLTGSNLDPLPTSAPDFLILQGLALPVNNPPVGDEDHAKFSAATKFTNNPALWSYVLDGAGRIKEIDTAQPGLYEVDAQYSWAAPGAAAIMQTLINVNAPSLETWNGVGMFGVSPNDEIVTANRYDGFTRGVFPISNLGGIITVQPVNHSAAAVNFVCVYLTILRHTLPKAS